MDFNFYEQYQQLRNTELLLMLEKQEQYQETAIAAAKKVLGERDVTEEDKRAVQAVLDAEVYAAEQKKQKKQRKEQVVAEVAGYIVPLDHSPVKFDPHKAVNVLLVALAIYFLMRVYSNGLALYYIYDCASCELDTLTMIGLTEIIFIPVVFYLFWKRMRWGWMLLLGAGIFVLGDRLLQWYFVFGISTTRGNDHAVLFMSVFIRSMFIYALLQRNVVEIFSVSKKDKESTLIVTSVLLFLYAACIVMWMNGISF